LLLILVTDWIYASFHCYLRLAILFLEEAPDVAFPSAQHPSRYLKGHGGVAKRQGPGTPLTPHLRAL
jgi:hypothetical protein